MSGSSKIHGIGFMQKLLPSGRSLPIILLAGILSGGVTIHVYVSLHPSMSAVPSVARQQFGLIDYERLKTGMTLTDVQAILGKGTELESTATLATYEWKNADGSGLRCTFKQGKLNHKKQFITQKLL
jgi:hypothetical protein